ncbi:MAG: hypothetical protein LQ349_000195 [Xanthoria aureola]|nr:MAG: hypothetical protein LQ349_000195 [Xanthoria aureola]
MCAGCSSRKKQRTPAAMVSWSCFDAQKGEEQSALWTVVEALASRHVHRALRTWPVEQRRPSQELWAYRSCQKCMRETHRRHRVLHHRSRALPNLCRRCFHVAANGFFSDPGSKLKGIFPERVFLRAGELLPSPMERISAGALMDQVSMGEPPVTPYLLRRMSLNSQLEQITVSPGHSPLNACLGGRALPDRRSDKAPSCRSGLNLGLPKGSCRMSDSPKKGADAISSQWISSGNSGTPIRPPSWVLMVDCAFDCNRNRDSGEMEDEEEADPESALGDLGDDDAIASEVQTPNNLNPSKPHNHLSSSSRQLSITSFLPQASGCIEPVRGRRSAVMGFGDFSSICQKNAFPLCSLVGSGNGINRNTGIQPNCYARSVEFANTIIFEAATDFMHMLALGMAVIMVLHVRSKFTAVGRKEITTFFYIYMLLTMTSLVLDSGVIPPGSSAYPYFAAAQNGFTSALCTCLLVNGFVGFQLYEDGTTQSVWLLRGSSIGMFILSGGISLMTFMSWGLAPNNTLGLFVVLYLINAIFLLVYVVSQVILVTATLQDRWPLGHIGFGVLFFIIGQVILYVFGSTICNAVQHYLDGLFFATVCNLLAVMMVYKYWDSITKEDLEFSVGTKQGNWEVKELLPEDDRRATIYQDAGTSEYASSMYRQATPRTSTYGGYHT